MAEEFGGAGDRLRRLDRTNADADAAFALGELERLGDGSDDAVAQLADVGVVAREMLDDGEFIAADPGEGVGFAEEELQPLADLAEEIVACGVAERVVDLLEAI